jgi:hypothetical protein
MDVLYSPASGECNPGCRCSEPATPEEVGAWVGVAMGVVLLVCVWAVS